MIEILIFLGSSSTQWTMWSRTGVALVWWMVSALNTWIKIRGNSIVRNALFIIIEYYVDRCTLYLIIKATALFTWLPSYQLLASAQLSHNNEVSVTLWCGYVANFEGRHSFGTLQDRILRPSVFGIWESLLKTFNDLLILCFPILGFTASLDLEIP